MIYNDNHLSIWFLYIICSIFKILLIPSYYSTDFEVHRNWMAITYSLPSSLWYFENTSKWTLDYPPFFAWFEYILSIFAVHIDPNIIKITKDEYISINTIYFQRISVILFDIILFYSIISYTSYLYSDINSKVKIKIISIITFLNSGLLLIDHIHFQYNGMLLGLLLLSILNIHKGKDLIGGILYASLTMFKHIYLYSSLLYFIYLFRHYCFQYNKRLKKNTFQIKKFIVLGISILFIYLLAISSLFIGNLKDIKFKMIQIQIKQLVSRLFPIKRGLCHTYWAPNIWALYVGLDKLLYYINKYLFKDAFIWFVSSHKTGKMTGGILGDISFIFLPDIKPWFTIILTILFMIPILFTVWKNAKPTNFINGVIYFMMTSFMCGYHIHEKAILQVIIPLGILSGQSFKSAKLYFMISFIGCFSLFPLFFTPAEQITRLLLWIFHGLLSYYLLFEILFKEKNMKSLFNVYEILYFIGLIIVFVQNTIWYLFTDLFIVKKLPFLPLMTTSIYCAFGFIYIWFHIFLDFYRNNDNTTIKCIKKLR